MGVGHEAYDAELAAIAYGLLQLAGRRDGEKLYGIHRLHGRNGKIDQRCSRSGSGDGDTIIRFAQRIVEQGNFITIRWTLAHRGVEGNEQADQRAKEAAALPPLRTTTRHHSLAFLRQRATERATDMWRGDIGSRNSGRRAFLLPMAASRPSIRPQLRLATNRVAARFIQLLSGHAMIAPLVRERWRWTESDICWWCGKGRQSREHLPKECAAWT